MIKTYLTKGDKFFIPGLIHYLRSYIKECHICQLSRNDKPPVRQLQQRINLNYRPLSRLGMDLKVMHKPQVYIMYHRQGNKLFKNCANISFQIRRNR